MSFMTGPLVPDAGMNADGAADILAADILAADRAAAAGSPWPSIGRRALLQLLAGTMLTGCRGEGGGLQLGSQAADAAAVPQAADAISIVRPGPVVTVEQATRAALVAADRAAIAGDGMLRLPAGRYVLDSIRIGAGAVSFERGAVIVPANARSEILFDGEVIGGRTRLFDVAERGPGEPAAIVLGEQKVLPEWWGATASGRPDQGADDSLAWQQAIDALARMGGKIVGDPGATYPMRYPIVVTGMGVSIDLYGSRLLTDLARRNRAPATLMLIGDSREWNLDRIRERRIARDLFNYFDNPAYQDIGMRAAPGGRGTNIDAVRFPDAADPGIDGFSARRCEVKNGRIDYYDDVVFPGNYGVQFNNAAECTARKLTVRNVGQGFGFGSDMPPRVPYAIGCKVTDMVVERVNQTHTYYGAGFHGYARDCHDARVRVLDGARADTPDGNLWATNYALDCSSRGSGGECGRGTNGEGFAIGARSRGCRIREATVRDARRAFVNFGPLDIAEGEANAIIDATASDVDYLISVQSRNMKFVRVRGDNVRIAELHAENMNATGNQFVDCGIERIMSGAVPLPQVRALNLIQG